MLRGQGMGRTAKSVPAFLPHQTEIEISTAQIPTKTEGFQSVSPRLVEKN